MDSVFCAEMGRLEKRGSNVHSGKLCTGLLRKTDGGVSSTCKVIETKGLQIVGNLRIIF
jgi:hypothetical protein